MDEECEPFVDNESIMATLLKASPACVVALLQLGFDPGKLEFGERTADPAPLGSQTLNWIFRGVEAKALVPAAKAVRRRQRLTETDILISALQASLRGSEPNGIGYAVIRAAGLSVPVSARWWDRTVWSTCDSFLRKLIAEAKAISVVDPSHDRLQFLLFADDARIRLRPFGAMELALLAPGDKKKANVPMICRTGVIQPPDTIHREFTDQTILELEDLINSKVASEADFQKFFERNPFLLTGLDFTRAHPQPILHKDEGGLLIPDFFLEKIEGGWDAILDLKRPYEEMVSRRTNRVYFRQAVQNAVAQLKFYQEWFDSPHNRSRFEEAYGMKTYRPKMVIVMGRSLHFKDDIERIRLIENLPSHLTLWTYDDIVSRARRYLALGSLA